MRVFLIILAAAGSCGVAFAGEVSSAYTEFDTATDCTTFSSAGEDDGDWANLVCSGYRGYPVLVYYADARESLFYGFPPAGDLAPVWESFASFNSTAPKVEWRIESAEGRSVPFATIHRRFVSDAEDSTRQTQVLVVSKVGQLLDRVGCVVGLVMASGNPEANEQAREIADQSVRSFTCGADDYIVVDAEKSVPPFQRAR